MESSKTTSERLPSSGPEHRKETPKAASGPKNGSAHVFWSSGRVLQFLLAFRLLNALTIRTFFQPDEYYQALEPAWHDTYGSEGFAWITWEWRQHLRSSLHPSLFHLAYLLADLIATSLKLTPVGRTDLLLASPKVLQAGIATIGDYYTWKLGQRVYGQNALPAWSALALTVANPWQWFCSTRTFSNCLEMALTAVALYNWPFSIDDLLGNQVLSTEQSLAPGQKTTLSTADKSWRLKKAVVFATFATMLRPTNVVIWISLTAYLLIPSLQIQRSQTGNSPPRTASDSSASSPTKSWPSVHLVWTFVANLSVSGSLTLVVSVLRDCVFYGGLAFTPYNFLVFNVLMSLAVFYGNNDWHYYISQGYPLLLTTALPFTLVGMYQNVKNSQTDQKASLGKRDVLRGLTLIAITLPASFSILSHKEVRFIYPLLPAFHVLAASPVSAFFGPALLSSAHMSGPTAVPYRYAKRCLLVTLLALNVLIAFYTTQLHNSGLITVTDYLRHEFEHRYMVENAESPNGDGDNLSVEHMSLAFLMPCHSVPWRSHLQYPPKSNQSGIAAWALTCEPPLHITDPATKREYQDEADYFYQNPRLWLRTHMARDMPQRLSGPPGNLDKKHNPGLRVDPKIREQESRNRHIRRKKAGKQSSHLDIVDLLPELITSPPPSLSSISNSSQSLKRTLSSSRFSSLQMNPKYHSSQTTPTTSPSIRRPWPHYLVFFQHLESLMTQTLLSSYGYASEGTGPAYRECWRTFNSHWHDDWRRTGDVVVFCLWDDDADDGNGGALTKEEERMMPRLKNMPNSNNDKGDEKRGEMSGSRNKDRNTDRESSGQRMLKQLNREQIDVAYNHHQQ